MVVTMALKQFIQAVASFQRDSATRRVVALLCLLMLSLPARAALTASVDRQQISANESLELTLSSELDLTSAFSFFDLNTLNVSPPDVTELEKDFEILDRRQNYRVQIINNQNQSVVVWNYVLLPRKTGTLQIPAFEWEGQTSNPIAIEVTQAAPESTKASPASVELIVDSDSAYVQQQVLVTVRLRYSDDLVRGELEHPDHPDALFRQLGEQKEFSRFEQGRQIKVVERRYALFPRKPGILQIPALQFQGQFLEPRTGRRVARRAQSPPVAITVNPPPANYSGKTWLPAQGLVMQQGWSPDTLEIQVGESVSRQIEIQALGLEGVSLPELAVPDIPGLKSYPEPAKTETRDSDVGVNGTRRENLTLIVTQPGEYEIPELTLTWWDVSNQIERTAKVPGRTLRVVGAARAPSSPADSGAEPMASSQLDAATQSEPDAAPGWGWLWLIAGLVSGFLLGVLFTRRQIGALPPGQSPGRAAHGSTSSADWSELNRLAQKDPTRLVTRLPLWLDTYARVHGLSRSGLEKVRSAVDNEWQALEARRFGAASEHPVQESDQELARTLLDRLRTGLESGQKKGRANALPSLYPMLDSRR